MDGLQGALHGKGWNKGWKKRTDRVRSGRMDGFQGALNGKDGNRGQTGSEVDAWMGFRVHCTVNDVGLWQIMLHASYRA